MQDHVSFFLFLLSFSSTLSPLLRKLHSSLQRGSFLSLSLFSSNTFTKIHGAWETARPLGGSVQPQVIRFSRNEIDRLRRINKTSVLDLLVKLDRGKLESKKIIFDYQWNVRSRVDLVTRRIINSFANGESLCFAGVSSSNFPSILRLRWRKKKREKKEKQETKYRERERGERRAFLRKME